VKLDAKSILVPTAILFVICVVVSAALAGTNLLTKDQIAKQQAAKSEASRKVVLSTAQTFEEKDGYYVGMADGAVVGYVFETESKGYGGTVKVMTGIDSEGNISGVVILSHSETPGLGANAEKADFLDQFLQPASGEIQVIKYQTPAEGQIEAMTGATITSKAVTDAVNQAVAQYNTVKGGA
jgi:electron transport complex protein RnfG